MNALAICIALVVSLPLPQRNAPEITLFTATFDSPTVGSKSTGVIGKRATTIVGLQILNNLRRIPTPNPNNLDFGSGIVTWAFERRPPASFAEAESLAEVQLRRPQLVLWGKAWEYGTGIVLESYLSIRRDGIGDLVGKDVWRITVGTPADKLSVSVDVPNWRYEFKPIVLDPDVLPGIIEPRGLKLYADSNGANQIGYLGDYFSRRLDRGSYTQVEMPGNVTGWVHLPGLSTRRSEVVDFSSGLIQFFRHDWAGALKLLTEVVKEKKDSPQDNIPTSIRIDAFLYMAIASHMRGNPADALGFIQQAYQLNRFRKATIQYLCMHYLAKIAKAPKGRSALESRQRIRNILDENRALFSTSDDWVMNLRRVLDAVDR